MDVGKQDIPAAVDQASKPMQIGWFVSSMRFDIASIRYRAFYPAAGLEGAAFESHFFTSAGDLLKAMADLDAVVIVKRLDPQVLPVVSSANDHETPVILDLCDDVLDVDYRGDQHELFQMVFEAIAPRLSRIVVTGTFLKQRFMSYGVPENKLAIVPDCVETDQVVERARKFLERRGHEPPRQEKPAESASSNSAPPPGLVRRVGGVVRRPKWWLKDPGSALKYIMTAPEPVVAQPARPVDELSAALELTGRTVVWFGNHGGPHSDFGMLTLLRVAKEIREAHAELPFTLVVVSDHREKWQHFIQAIGVPTVYVGWTQQGCRQLLEKAWAVLLPVGEDTFSRAKSANRVLLALELRAAPVAEPLDSLVEIGDSLPVGRVRERLIEVLSSRSKAREAIVDARRAVHEHFGMRRVAADWGELLRSVEGYRKDRSTYGASRRPEKALVFVNLVQDTPLALRVVDELREREVETAVVVSFEAVRNNPRLARGLIERRIAPTYMSAKEPRRGDYRWLRGATMLFCPSESSASPHSKAHELTKLARRAGLRTYTAQNGLEQPGLTHRDGEFANVGYASDTIFTWLAPEGLPVWMPAETRARCVGVGRILGQQVAPDGETLRERMGVETGPLVTVFENLHWTRYTDGFRKSFVDRLMALAQSRPEVHFLLMPHPAGRWSAKNISGQQLPSNLSLFRPADPKNADISVAHVLAQSDAVITTTSTVALDAAQAGRPVAVVGGEGVSTDSFEGLPVLDTAEAWAEFCGYALSGGRPADTAAFLARSCLEGDAAPRIVDAMLSVDQGQTQVAHPDFSSNGASHAREGSMRMLGDNVSPLRPG